MTGKKSTESAPLIGLIFSAWRIAAVVILLFFFTACSQERYISPEAKRGILDLREWDFAKNGSIDLDGEWAFYWKEFLKPQEIPYQDPEQFCTVPGSWTVAGDSFSSVGHGTYRLRILLSENTPPLAIRFKNIHTAYRAYCNGRLVAQQGTVADEKSNSTPQTIFQTAFIPSSTTMNLLIHVSNFYHKDAGIIIAMQLGAEGGIHKINERSIVLDFFLFGSIFIIALYYLMLYILRRENQAFLYFSLFCFVIAFRIFLFGNVNYSYLFDSVSWYFMFKAAIITYFLSLIFFPGYVSRLYPDEFPSGIFRIIAGTVSILIIIAVFGDTMLVSLMVPYSHIITVVVSIYIIFSIIRAALNKREGAWIFLAGFVIIMAAITNDILYDNLVIQTAFLVPAGLFLFLLLQTILLSWRYTLSLHELEKLSGKLDQNNDDLIRALVDLKFSQERLIRQEKMAAIGNLASGMAHEIRNQLTAITFLEVLDYDFSPEEEAVMNEAMESRDRISSMVNEVRALAKDETAAYSFSYYPVKDIISETLTLAAIAPGINHEIIKTNILNEGFIYADKHKLIQMLLYLFENATEAIAAKTEDGEKEISLIIQQEAVNLRIDVEDNGDGIDPSILDDIWEPFFSTRGNDHTGIGLDLCLRIVNGHHGTISCSSVPGEKTCFTVRIPLSGSDDNTGGDLC